MGNQKRLSPQPHHSDAQISDSLLRSCEKPMCVKPQSPWCSVPAAWALQGSTDGAPRILPRRGPPSLRPGRAVPSDRGESSHREGGFLLLELAAPHPPGSPLTVGHGQG